MVARLFLFIIAYLLAFGVPATAIGYKVYKKLEPGRKRKHARKLAEHHAKLLAASLRDNDDQICFHCDKPCNENDCYEEGKGWYHESCMRNLLNA